MGSSFLRAFSSWALSAPWLEMTSCRSAPQCQFHPCLFHCCRKIVDCFYGVLNSIEDNGVVPTFDYDECQQGASQCLFDMGLAEGRFEN